MRFIFDLVALLKFLVVLVLQLEICNPVDSSFPINDFSFLDKHIFILEVATINFKWLSRNPYMTFGPMKMIFNMLP